MVAPRLAFPSFPDAIVSPPTTKPARTTHRAVTRHAVTDGRLGKLIVPSGIGFEIGRQRPSYSMLRPSIMRSQWTGDADKIIRRGKRLAVG